MNPAKMITMQIDPCNLACTSGMLLEHFPDKALAKEFANQVQHQLIIQGVDPEEVLTAFPKGLPMISFILPVGVLVSVANTFLGLKGTKDQASAAWLMKAWTPALKQALGLVERGVEGFGSDGLFDSFGRCMN
tara:strand:- start:91 stop:489 length:399 start_codon:yes stop_codon:yes gene_type:complete